MSKEVQFTMKVEPELRDQFMAEAEAAHRPASQVNRPGNPGGSLV